MSVVSDSGAHLLGLVPIDTSVAHQLAHLLLALKVTSSVGDGPHAPRRVVDGADHSEMGTRPRGAVVDFGPGAFLVQDVENLVGQCHVRRDP